MISLSVAKKNQPIITIKSITANGQPNFWHVETQQARTVSIHPHEGRWFTVETTMKTLTVNARIPLAHMKGRWFTVEISGGPRFGRHGEHQCTQEVCDRYWDDCKSDNSLLLYLSMFFFEATPQCELFRRPWTDRVVFVRVYTFKVRYGTVQYGMSAVLRNDFVFFPYIPLTECGIITRDTWTDVRSSVSQQQECQLIDWLVD